jgi:hypothetical protein
LLSRARNIAKKTSLEIFEGVLVFLRICMRYHVWVAYLYGFVSAIEIKIFWECKKLQCLLEKLVKLKCLTQNKLLVMEFTRNAMTCMISNGNFALTFPDLTTRGFNALIKTNLHKHE